MGKRTRGKSLHTSHIPTDHRLVSLRRCCLESGAAGYPEAPLMAGPGEGAEVSELGLPGHWRLAGLRPVAAQVNC